MRPIQERAGSRGEPELHFIRYVERVNENGEEYDDEEEVRLPSRYEVCGRCRGRGVHDPEAFSGGFSVEEFHEDPDFAEEYLSGRYDVSCSVCGGRRVELRPDWDRMSDELQAEVREAIDREARFRAEAAYERRMGF